MRAHRQRRGEDLDTALKNDAQQRLIVRQSTPAYAATRQRHEKRLRRQEANVLQRAIRPVTAASRRLVYSVTAPAGCRTQPSSAPTKAPNHRCCSACTNFCTYEVAMSKETGYTTKQTNAHALID